MRFELAGFSEVAVLNWFLNSFAHLPRVHSFRVIAVQE